MVKILLKRTDDSSKNVTAENLEYGELALKYSKEDGGLYYKNAEDEIEKIKNSSDISAEIDSKVSRLMDEIFVFTITGTPIADSTEEFPHNCTFTADKTYDEFLSAYNEKKRIVIKTVIVLSAEESGFGDVTEVYSEVDDFYLFKLGEKHLFAFKYSVIIPIWGGGLTEYIIMLGKQNGELVIDFLGDYYTNSQDLSILSNYAGKLSRLDEIKYNLAELNDVGVETPSNGQKLIYDSNSQKWINVDDNMPTPTTSDSGKFLRVDVNGKYVLETIQSAEELTY